MKSNIRQVARITLVPMLLLVCGCGGGGEPLQSTDVDRVPVSGRVLIGRQPVGGATVTFEPKFEWKQDLPKPKAITDADGNFEIGTVMTGDGAPSGEYQVAIASAEGENALTLDEKLKDPGTSGLKAAVGDKPVKLPDFIVKKGSGSRSASK
jgi:hypothetical protein